MHRPFGSLVSGALLLCPLLVASPAAAQDKAASAPLKPEELQALLAPIALYPDPLLAQVLMASTYPLEVVGAARWSKANPKVTGKDLEDAMLKQTWDPSVKSLCSFPDPLAMMNEKLDWTQKLGDAFLAQQDDVMEAVQALRAKAQASGNLKSSKELTVTTEKPEPPPASTAATAAPATQTVIVIQPANPQVVYVPQYNPTVVYGAWPYPAYPPYPVYPPGYVAATAVIGFGVGLAVGAAMWGNCSWGYRGYSSVNINVNNYNRYNHTNINVNNVTVNNRNTANWNHNSAHRQGVPYNNTASQQKYGGSRAAADAQSREAFRGREGGMQNSGNQPGQRPSGGAANPGQAQRPGGGGGGTQQRPGSGGGGVQRPSTGAAAGGGVAQRPGGGGGGTQRPGGTSGSHAGGGAFQGMNNGGQARANSARGHSSLGGGGGGHGGGGRRR